MSRDHRKLRAFQISDGLVTDIYCASNSFPKDEWYGLRAQVRRAAVSVPSNLVEGSARLSTKDYLNFCNIACGSAFETRYLCALACRLRYMNEVSVADLMPRLDELCASLVKLVAALEARVASESGPRGRRPPRDLRPET